MALAPKVTMGDALRYYQGEVLDALALQCRGREVWLRRGDTPSPRPLKADTREEMRALIEHFSGPGYLSVYASVERFSDPLKLAEEKPEALRVGWDFVLDLDAEDLDRARESALALAGLLKTFGIEGFKLKFSGARGFHITIPGDAFDCFAGGHGEYIAAYPQVPRVMAEFLQASIKPEQRRGVKIDHDIYSSRRMLRVAYGLHPQTGLVSLPLSVKEVRNFRRENAASSSNMKVDWGWLNLQARVGEAAGLLDAVAEWRKRNRKQPGLTVVKRGNTGSHRGGYRWVERLLANPVDDGRHRLLWLVIAPYLVNVKGLSVEEAIRQAQAYIERCSQVKTLRSDIRRLVRYYVQYAARKRLKPPSLATLKTRYPDLYDIVSHAQGGA